MAGHPGKWQRVGPGRYKSPIDGKTYNSDTDPTKSGGIPQSKGQPNPAYGNIFAGAPAAGAPPGAAPSQPGAPAAPVTAPGEPPPAAPAAPSGGGHSGAWTRVGPGRWRSPVDGKTYNSDTDPTKSGGVPQWRGKPNPTYANTFTAGPAAPTGPAPGDVAQPTPEQIAEQKKNEAVNKLLGPGIEGASALAEKLFPEGSLGRMEFVGPEGREIVQRYKGIADRYASGQPSADVQDIMNRYKAGLEGYNSQELNAMREESLQGIESDAQTQARRLQKAQGANVQGGARTAQLQRLNQSKLGARGNLERDLFIKNADERQRRLGEYSGLVQGVEQQGYERSLGSLGQYENAYGSLRQEDVRTKQYNDQKVADEMAGRYGTIFGGLNLGLAQQAQAEDFALNQEYLDIAKKRYGTTRKPGSSGGNAYQSTNPYYQEAINLIRGS